MKPSWNDAPPWANWLAQDHDGDWFWYEFEPEYLEPAGWWYARGRLLLAVRTGIEAKNPDFTLEARPA